MGLLKLEALEGVCAKNGGGGFNRAFTGGWLLTTLLSVDIMNCKYRLLADYSR